MVVKIIILLQINLSFERKLADEKESKDIS